MKVNSKIYKGIEYIQLNDLPKDQQILLLQDLNDEFLIKIQVDKSIVSNCIQYKDYDFWFETVYKPTLTSTAKPERQQLPATFEVLIEKA